MIETREDEILNFKRNINLSQLAASYGFVRDPKRSTNASVSMENENGYRLVISKSNAGHWQYFSPSDEQDKGTVIDFIQKVQGVNIGDVRKFLRTWSSSPAPDIPDKHYQSVVEVNEKDREKVVKYLSKIKPLLTSKYLSLRGISGETLRDPLFRGQVLKGYDDAVIFPHRDESGVCGYEVKKQNFTSFPKHGIKSIWRSNIPEKIESLIFLESGVEALAYYQLHKPEHSILFSPCGNWSVTVSELLSTIFEKYRDVEVIAAFNQDKGGIRQTDKLSLIAKGSKFTSHRPEIAGKDWNNILQMGMPISKT